MQRALIVGAAGRDFHNFNVFFRDHPDYTVVGFTAAQTATTGTCARSMVWRGPSRR